MRSSTRLFQKEQKVRTRAARAVLGKGEQYVAALLGLGAQLAGTTVQGPAEEATGGRVRLPKWRAASKGREAPLSVFPGLFG